MYSWPLPVWKCVGMRKNPNRLIPNLHQKVASFLEKILFVHPAASESDSLTMVCSFGMPDDAFGPSPSWCELQLSKDLLVWCNNSSFLEALSKDSDSLVEGVAVVVLGQTFPKFFDSFHCYFMIFCYIKSCCFQILRRLHFSTFSGLFAPASQCTVVSRTDSLKTRGF